MDDHIRASDADRDRIAARLRDHFAEGRLTRGELDERISAALNAKTFGDLRPIMSDLPEPAPTPRPLQPQLRGAPPGLSRGPRVLPLMMALLFITLLTPQGGLLAVALFNLLLVFWLATGVAGFLMVGRIRRRTHRNGPPGYTPGGSRQVHWL